MRLRFDVPTFSIELNKLCTVREGKGGQFTPPIVVAVVKDAALFKEFLEGYAEMARRQPPLAQQRADFMRSITLPTPNNEK